MKKWMYTLICLGYLTPALATDHASFLVSGEDLQEMSYLDHILETPNFFTRVYPQNLNPNLVIIPRTNSGFEFGLMGFFQRPNDNQTDFAISEVGSPPFFVVSPNSPIRAIDPDHEFAYGAYFGYLYPYMARDIRLDVFNFSGSSTGGASAAGDGVVWTPLALYDLTTIANNAAAKLDTDIEQAKLMIGQLILAGAHFQLHPSLGAKYASINRELDTHYPFASAPPMIPDLTTAFVEQKSRFSGIGPAVQVDGTYFFTPRFGLIGHLTSAILIGSIRSEIRYVDDRVPAGSTQINLPSSDRAVPNLDGQLGFIFRHQFCGTHTSVEFEVGYEFNHFFNAFDTYRSTGIGVLVPDLEPPGPLLPATITHVKHVHDFTLDGPYLSIGLSGIACPSNVVIDPIQMTVPRMEGGFIFGLGAGYFTIGNNQLDYALLDPTAFSFLGVDLGQAVPTLNATLQTVKPDNAYGGLITAGHIFRYTPYDVIAHYREVVQKDTARTEAPPTGVIWTILSAPIFDNVTTRSYATHASATANFNYHDVNLEVGQTICAGSLIWLRLFGGLQYASINSNLHTTYTNVSIAGADGVYPEENIVQKSTFHGIGPRVGFDMTLPVQGFALSSHLAVGLLAGSIDGSFKDEFPDVFSDPGILLLDGGSLGVRENSETQSSPFLDLKVGLAYAFHFFGQTKWTLDIGYMAVHYFNAATNFRHATNNAEMYIKQVNDVTLEGPYLNLTVSGFDACAPDCIVREPYMVFAPILRGGFEFALEGLYLEPHVANTDYCIADPSPDPFIGGVGLAISPSSLSQMKVLSPSHEFGSRVHLGYIFPLSANDISINYAGLKGNTINATNAEQGGVLWTITNGNYTLVPSPALPPPAPFFPFPVIANRAQASVDFTWQTGNFEFGRRIKFHQLMTRFFAGLAYAKVIEDIDITYTGGSTLTSPNDPFDPVAISSTTVDQDNSFHGFGPRLGMSMDIALGGCGFSLVGQLATDLLVGNIDTQFVETTSDGLIAGLNPEHRTRLVPAVDAKLGFGYSIPFRNCSQFGIELGYQVNHYFNAKDSLRFTDNFSTFIKQDQDIGFDGPYIRIQVDI